MKFAPSHSLSHTHTHALSEGILVREKRFPANSENRRPSDRSGGAIAFRAKNHKFVWINNGIDAILGGRIFVGMLALKCGTFVGGIEV